MAQKHSAAEVPACFASQDADWQIRVWAHGVEEYLRAEIGQDWLRIFPLPQQAFLSRQLSCSPELLARKAASRLNFASVL
jgi:hypothetical protein